METSQSARRRRTFTQRQNIKSFVGLPLLGKRDSLIGFLCINYRRRHEFYPEEKQLIHHFAEQAAVALEESGRHRQARSLAITQERSHLAAELHHTLSQQLYGLKQYTKAACVYAERADMSKAVENLHKVQTVVNTSLNSLQHILNELHERPQSNFNFVEDISAHSRNMQALCEIDIRLETCAPAGQAVLPRSNSIWHELRGKQSTTPCDMHTVHVLTSLTVPGRAALPRSLCLTMGVGLIWSGPDSPLDTGLPPCITSRIS